MSKNHTLFIFRRDLRLIDNNGLIFADKTFSNIIPIFIFTPEQIKNNKYKSNNAVQFMCESLKELDINLKKKNSKLHIFHGDNITILNHIIKKINISNIVFNMDYTPYAIKRDKEIQNLCKTNNIGCHIIEDYLLCPIGSLNKSDGNPYTIYTPFKNNALKSSVPKPNNYILEKLVKFSGGEKIIKYKVNKNILVHGGRKNGTAILNKDFSKYVQNDLSKNTTQLSAYIKFGCISIREVYWKLKPIKKIIEQLVWREFYTYIAFYFPRVLKGSNFNAKYNEIKWRWSKKQYDAWCEGKTGYPIVDAGIRELNATGFMHNRARLITANFLNRILGMNWIWGELYFAQKLTDYDPAVNSGNHQWVASVGVDPKPYFQRLFNPWIQSKKFDKNAEYIKKWLPELKHIEPKHIHEWDKYYSNHNIYIKPIVDYKINRDKSIKMYRDVL